MSYTEQAQLIINKIDENLIKCLEEKDTHGEYTKKHNPYNIYMRFTIPFLKDYFSKQNITISHLDAFKASAITWKISEYNPKNQKNQN